MATDAINISLTASRMEGSVKFPVLAFMAAIVVGLSPLKSRPY